MKKVIISALFLVAFSTGLLAKQAVEVPIIEKEVPKVEESNILYCANIVTYICFGGETYYINGYSCSQTEDSFYEMSDAMMSTCN